MEPLVPRPSKLRASLVFPVPFVNRGGFALAAGSVPSGIAGRALENLGSAFLGIVEVMHRGEALGAGEFGVFISHFCIMRVYYSGVEIYFSAFCS